MQKDTKPNVVFQLVPTYDVVVIEGVYPHRIRKRTSESKRHKTETPIFPSAEALNEQQPVTFSFHGMGTKFSLNLTRNVGFISRDLAVVTRRAAHAELRPTADTPTCYYTGTADIGEGKTGMAAVSLCQGMV